MTRTLFMLFNLLAIDLPEFFPKQVKRLGVGNHNRGNAREQHDHDQDCRTVAPRQDNDVRGFHLGTAVNVNSGVTRAVS